VGAAGAEVMREMDMYVEVINAAETDEDVTDIINDILEEVPVADYDGAEDIVQFLEGFVGKEKSEPADAEKTEGEAPAKAEDPAKKEDPVKTLRYNFPGPIKK
jgi:hypothetical protein